MTPPDSVAVATRTARSEQREGAQVDLLVGGMTCAACAARIEKRLNSLDGVVATVNFATATARPTPSSATRAAPAMSPG